VTERYKSLQGLLSAVKRATKARGKRTQLADDLDVSRQQLNGWLNGHKVPSGEVTLRLINWLDEQAKKRG